MAKNVKNQVNEYFTSLSSWKSELTLLREIVLSTGLEEGYKWKHPCYMDQGKNIVLLHEFKDYCAIMFFKGVLLKDTAGLLTSPTERIQSGRQMRFTSLDQVKKYQDTIVLYISEAVELERSGAKVEMKKTAEYDVPVELEETFSNDQTYYEAFNKLTPGRQRGYLLYFGGAKQSTTRFSRIQNSKERILAGKGIHDCICGLSATMPRCDGSHKQLKTQSKKR